MAGGINIASLFATIGADTSGFEKGISGAKSSLEGFAGDLVKKAVAFTSFAAVATAAGKFISSSVNDWSTYADNMRLAADTAGITTTEMSKLVQAADDFRVPMGAMQNAMELALKNGFTPTIDNLAALSDKLLAIEDPAERAALASSIFGKSYADMMPFLLAGGDAIRETTSAVADNLIVTKESADQAKEYKDQLDALGDAWTGLKNNAGKVFLPLFISVITTLSNALDTGDGGKAQLQALSQLQKAYDDGAMGKEQYEQLTRDVINGFVDEAEGAKIANDAISSHNKVTAAASDTNQSMLLSLFENTNSWKEFSDAARRSGLDIVMLTEEIYNSEKGITSLSAVTDDAAASEANLNAEAAAQAEIAEAAAAAWDEYVAAVRDITSLDANFGSIISLAKNYDGVLKEITAQEAIMAAEPTGSEKWLEAKKNIDDLKKSMTDMANQMTLDMLQATIAIDGITSKEAASYFQMAADMGLISEEAAAAAIAAYGNAVETINGYAFEDKELTMTSNAAEIWSTLEMIDALILADKNMNINITKTYYGSGGLEGQDPYENWGGATGGYISKGGLINVGEHGKELVYLPDHAQIIPHSRTNETIDALTNGQSTVINNYNLTMPTTANAGDIRTAFELMEAWA